MVEMRFKTVFMSLGVMFMMMVLALPTVHSETLGWTTPIRIGSGQHVYGTTPSAASNPAGEMVAAWVEYDGSGGSSLWVNRFNASSGWFGAYMLVDGTNIGGPCAGIDDLGNCLVAWSEGNTVKSRNYTVGTGWEDATRVAVTSANWTYGLTLAVAPDGAALAMWSVNVGEDLWSSYRAPGSAWSDPTEVMAEFVAAENYDVACDSDGDFIGVFSLYDGSRWGLWSSAYTPEQGWGPSTAIDGETGYAVGFSLAMNRAGEAFAVWQQFAQPFVGDSVAYANTYNSTTGWGLKVPIEDPTFGGCDPPTVAVDSFGNAVAIWRSVAHDMMSSCLRTNTYLAESGWGTPATLEDSFDCIDEHISVGTADSEFFAAWIKVKISDNMTFEGYDLIGEHYNFTAGWEQPTSIPAVNISSPCVVSDNRGSAAIIWYDYYWEADLFACHYGKVFPEPPLPPPPPPATVVTAAVDFEGDTFNIKSNGEYVTAYIQLPVGCSVSDIDVASVTLNGLVKANTEKYEITDENRDGVPELCVKFSRSEFASLAKVGSDFKVTVVGKLVNGTYFLGEDHVRVINPGAATLATLSLLLPLVGGDAIAVALASAWMLLGVTVAAIVLSAEYRYRRGLKTGTSGGEGIRTLGQSVSPSTESPK